MQEVSSSHQELSGNARYAVVFGSGHDVNKGDATTSHERDTARGGCVTRDSSSMRGGSAG
jgi:hypothetical protein